MSDQNDTVIIMPALPSVLGQLAWNWLRARDALDACDLNSATLGEECSDLTLALQSHALALTRAAFAEPLTHRDDNSRAIVLPGVGVVVATWPTDEQGGSKPVVRLIPIAR